MIRTCSQGHTLKEFTTPDADYACDICSAGIDKGATLWGCRICEYDVCIKCRNGSTKALAGAGGTASPTYVPLARAGAPAVAPVPAAPESTTPVYEVTSTTNTVRAEPVTSARMKTKKSRGSRLFCEEVTVDGWLKLAKEPGWLLTNFRGMDGVHEAARAVDGGAIDLAVPGFHSQGIACLEVLPKSGVPVWSVPSKGSKRLHVRKCGERVFVRSQNFDCWARLVGEEGWVQRRCPDAGDGFALRTAGCRDHWALCDLWSAVRKAKNGDLSVTDIEALKEVEVAALISTALAFDQCSEAQSVSSLVDEGILEERQLDNHELQLRQLTFASILRQMVTEQQKGHGLAVPTDALLAHMRLLRRAVPQFDYQDAERPKVLTLKDEDLTKELFEAVKDFEMELQGLKGNGLHGRFKTVDDQMRENPALLLAQAQKMGMLPDKKAVAPKVKYAGPAGTAQFQPEFQAEVPQKPEPHMTIQSSKAPAVRASLNYSKFDNIEDSGSEDEHATQEAMLSEEAQYRKAQEEQGAQQAEEEEAQRKASRQQPSLLATDEQRKAARAAEAKRRAARAAEEAEKQRRADGGAGGSAAAPQARGGRGDAVKVSNVRTAAPPKSAYDFPKEATKAASASQRAAPQTAPVQRAAPAAAKPTADRPAAKKGGSGLDYSKFDKLAESDSEDERSKKEQEEQRRIAAGNYASMQGLPVPEPEPAPAAVPEQAYDLPQGKPRIPGYGKDPPRYKPAGPPQKTMAYKEGLTGLPMRQDEYDYSSLPPFIYEGNCYRMAPNGVLWDPPAKDPIGIWNPVAKRVEPVAGTMPPGSVPGMLPGQQVSMLCYFGKTYILLPDNSVVDPETQEVVSIFNTETRQLQPITPVPLSEVWADKDMNVPMHIGDDAHMPPAAQSVGLTSRSLPECLDAAQNMFEKGRFEPAAGLLDEALYECRKQKVVDVDVEVLILRKRADCWSRVGRYAELQSDVDELLELGIDDGEVQEFRRICEVATQHHVDGRGVGIKTLPAPRQAAKKISEPTIRCAYCTVPTSKPSMCTRCRNTFYCDGVCQRKHWSVHKEECGKPRAALPPPERSAPMAEPEDIEGTMEDMD